MNPLPEFTLTGQTLDILVSQGVPLDRGRFLDAMKEFYRACSTWNLAAKLVSKRDLESRFDDHIADSLTLIPHIHDRPALTYVDIGSGGGFPALPIATALANREVWLIERSQRKADYLRHAVKTLGLSKAHVVSGRFPCQLEAPVHRIYTARAIEGSEIFDGTLIKQLGPADIYLMQRQPGGSLPLGDLAVIPIEDEFGKSGLRRGVLYRISY